MKFVYDSKGIRDEKNDHSTAALSALVQIQEGLTFHFSYAFDIHKRDSAVQLGLLS